VVGKTTFKGAAQGLAGGRAGVFEASHILRMIFTIITYHLADINVKIGPEEVW
jgi:hypothetical protein